jgi:hypothetical protein
MLDEWLSQLRAKRKAAKRAQQAEAAARRARRAEAAAKRRLQAEAVSQQGSPAGAAAMRYAMEAAAAKQRARAVAAEANGAQRAAMPDAERARLDAMVDAKIAQRAAATERRRALLAVAAKIAQKQVVAGLAGLRERIAQATAEPMRATLATRTTVAQATLIAELARLQARYGLEINDAEAIVVAEFVRLRELDAWAAAALRCPLVRNVIPLSYPEKFVAPDFCNAHPLIPDSEQEYMGDSPEDMVIAACEGLIAPISPKRERMPYRRREREPRWLRDILDEEAYPWSAVSSQEEPSRPSADHTARTHVKRNPKESKRLVDTPSPNVRARRARPSLTPKSSPLPQPPPQRLGPPRSPGGTQCSTSPTRNHPLADTTPQSPAAAPVVANTYVSVRERKAVFAVLNNADTPVCVKLLSMKSGIDERTLDGVLAVLVREKFVKPVQTAGGVGYCRG